MAVEKSYRPISFDDYQGQDRAKKALQIYIKSAHMRHDALDHTIIYGPSGTGKSTLAGIIANEMGGRFRVFSAPAIKKIDDITEILVSVEENDIVFLDEIHRLNAKCEEQLFLAMEQFQVNVTNDDYNQTVTLPHFTVIGATTACGMLSEPLRNRFGITVELQSYTVDDMTGLVIRSFQEMGIEVAESCAQKIASRGRGVPRLINGFVRRVRDFALAINEGEINDEIVETTFEVLDINPLGLTRQDRRYLELLVGMKGRPLGVDQIAARLNDDKATIENVVEPYLLQQGYIYRTPRGRIVSDEGIEALNL